jgi:hypothetical protein
MHSPPTASTRTPTQTMGKRVHPRTHPALQLPFGSVVCNAISGRQYRVGTLLGAGGFGAVYRVAQLAG